MLPKAGTFVTTNCLPAMFDFTLREFALAAAIVFILASWFIDRQILNAAVEALNSFR
jgi:hypothetical protein